MGFQYKIQYAPIDLYLYQTEFLWLVHFLFPCEQPRQLNAIRNKLSE
jgi:hypothetical protein